MISGQIVFFLIIWSLGKDGSNHLVRSFTFNTVVVGYCGGGGARLLRVSISVYIMEAGLENIICGQCYRLLK